MARPVLWNTANFKELGKSNYSRLLEQHDIIDDLVLQFSNDSSVINGQSSELLSALLGNYKSDTDIIRVVGSSHGKGNYEDAQEDLARSRAANVTEALILIGVDPEKVYAEASWSKDYFDEVMPRRGVVVSVRRLKR